MARRRELTDKQAAFLEAYLTNGRNASEAYRWAYNPVNANDTTINREASRLLHHPLIAPRIEAAEHRVVAMLQAAEDTLVMSKLEVAQELSKIGRSNMMDYATVQSDGHPYIDLTGLDRIKAAAIKAFKVEEFVVPPAPDDGEDAQPRPVRKITFTLHDKIAALRDLAKLKGYMVERKELRFKRLSEMSDEELEMLLLEATGEQT